MQGNVLSLACFNLLLIITIILFPFLELGHKLTEKLNGLPSVMQILNCEAELETGIVWLQCCAWMLINTLLCCHSMPPVHPLLQHTYTRLLLFKICLCLVYLVTSCLHFVERCWNYYLIRYISEICFIKSFKRFPLLRCKI